MSEDPIADESARDLVLVTLPGVQRFVAESRRTADLFVSSRLMSELGMALAGAVQDPAKVVLPTVGGAEGVPNRVVALTPAGTGETLAGAMVGAVRDAWRVHDPNDEVVGFPVVQWVVIPPGEGGYQGQWERGQALLAQRKRIRDFRFPPVPQTRVCTLTGRWPGSPAGRDGRTRRGEFLSRVGQIKRDTRERFPSTWSIATAPYRAEIITAADRFEDLQVAIELLEIEVLALQKLFVGRDREQSALRGKGGDLPGIPVAHDKALNWFREAEGSWCLPAGWDPEALRLDHDLSWPSHARNRKDCRCEYCRGCGGGRESALALQEEAGKAGVTPPTPYLAVLAQDADRLGISLGDRRFAVGPMADWQGQVSQALHRAGELQRVAIEEAGLGRVVYAGGDDVLALVPLSSATRAARLSLDAFQEALGERLPGATASTALVFFHASSPLQSAVAEAQRLLDEVKAEAAVRPGVGVSVLRRGGRRATWLASPGVPGGPDPLARLDVLVAAMRTPGADGALSPRFAMGLERDRLELGTLNRDWLRMELTRRAQRHGITAEAGEALLDLCAERGENRVPVDAALVAHFLAAEGARP